jgi:2-polyprenyl-3-methyl-5-hydroxy-6-metoxy-1,4-benzoquinol methylase
VAPASCPLCGGSSSHAFTARDRNREITQERFEYASCQSCGTLFIVDPPTDLGRYYEGDYYHFGPDGEPLWRSNEHRKRSASYRVGLVLNHVSRGHLIEIGSGTGAFASTAHAAGFDVSAIEMDERCCRYLSEREGINAICSDRPIEALSSLPPARVVAMWHVLEHLSNPAEILEHVAQKLQPGGVLAIGVPNPSSLQFRALGSRWAHLDAPRHLCLIPPNALMRKAEELGMRTLTVTTNDPEGLEFNLFGWISALRRRPATGAAPWPVVHVAKAVSRALAAVERRGHRGSTVTLIMRKEP